MNAREAFQIRHDNIITKIAELQSLVAIAEARALPPTLDWGQVGDLARLEMDLDDILGYFRFCVPTSKEG